MAVFLGSDLAKSSVPYVSTFIWPSVYHKKNGNGRPVEHTVPNLLRAILLKYLYNLSLRELETRIQYDIAAKWFVGYPVFANASDHSTLSRFESYLIFNHPRLFFDTILDLIDTAFPDEPNRPQIGDTFAMHADAALESLIKRLRHGAQELLLAYREDAPQAYEKLHSSIDRRMGNKRATNAH